MNFSSVATFAFTNILMAWLGITCAMLVCFDKCPINTKEIKDQLYGFESKKAVFLFQRALVQNVHGLQEPLLPQIKEVVMECLRVACDAKAAFHMLSPTQHLHDREEYLYVASEPFMLENNRDALINYIYLLISDLPHQAREFFYLN